MRVLGPGQSGDSNEPVVQIAVAPDGSRVATVRYLSSIVTVWDPTDEGAVFDVDLGAEVSAIDWTPDGSHLVVSSFGGFSWIVDATGEQVGDLTEDEGFSVMDARFSPDGRLLVTSARDVQGLDPHVTIWDWRNGTRVDRIPLDRAAAAIAFDPAGSRFALALDDGSVEVRDLTSGDRGLRFSVGSSPATDIAFSPDGSRLATAGQDGTVRLFDAGSGDELLTLRGHDFSVFGVAFSPDGSMLASASPEGLVRIWALELDDLIRIAEAEVDRDLTDEECRRYLHQPCS